MNQDSMTQQTSQHCQWPSIDQLIATATDRLSASGVDTPHYDAKLLLAQAFNCTLSDVDRSMLMRDTANEFAWHTDTEDSAEQRFAQFETFVERRAGREPLQHITGHAPFRYIDVQVGSGVFIPRPETETVVQSAIDWIHEHRMACPRVVDLCAGSGAIGLSIGAEIPGAHVWAVEIDPTAAQWTQRNRDALAATMPQIAENYHLTIADATNPLTLAELDGTVDVVISNPPYIPASSIPDQIEAREYDPDLALYGGSADGMMIPEAIITRASALLRRGGILVMEHDITQADRTRMFAQASGFTQVATHDDLMGRPRYVFAVRA